MKDVLRKLLVMVIVFALSSVNAWAQCVVPDDPGAPSDPSDPGYNENCPIDTWVYILVIAALVFGAHQLNKKSKIEAVDA